MQPDQYVPYSPQWVAHSLPPQHQPPPQHHPQGPPGPPSGGIPMSPRNPPPPLQQVPSTPTQSHALPPPLHPSHGPPSVTSPPPTPSTTNGPGRLNTNASAFVPGKKISIKNPNGQEVNLHALKSTPPVAVVPPPVPASPVGFKKENKRASIRMESPEQKEQRVAAEQEKARKAKEAEESERKLKEEKARKERERKEAEEKAAREKKEAAERAEREAKEAEERKVKEAAERAKKEAEEAERKRLEEEARIKQEQARLEEEERLRKEEAQRRKEAEEAAALAAAEAEAKAKAEAEVKAKADAEAAAAAAAAAKADVPDADAPAKEDGEIEEKEDPSPKQADVAPPVEQAPVKPVEKSLRIDTALTPAEPRRRPGPLNLSTTLAANVSAPLPSALATARIIEDLGRVSYPDGVKSPKVELNVNAEAGKFRYDREFLLQFMAICKDKPDNLPPLDAIGLEPSDQNYNMSRGGSGRRQASNSMSVPGSARSASGIGLGFVTGGMGGKSGPGFAMGQFATTASKLSSEERFMMASGGRSASVSSGLGGVPLGGRPSPITRTPSQGGPGTGKERDRIRSKRGEKRNESNRVSVSSHQAPSMGNSSSMGPPLEPVAPLEVSANRWVAGSTRRAPPVDTESPEIVDRKVKGLLNKLTMERFDSISDQIIAWANKSEKEKDGRTLIQVIRLVFEKATDEATFSEMYARLCRKMMEMISPKVQDDGIINQEGKPFAGGHLFRKYLLNRCQEDFERGWVAKETTAAAAATKAEADEATKAAQKDKEEESELYSDEYYAAAKAKRRGLGLIRFIGELFKLQMLTERIMHECIKKLLGNVENPEEEEIESLCKLLATVGNLLDTPKAHAHMDVYFSRMKELTKSKNVNSRMQYMLQDVIELRERKWVPRKQAAGPATIAQIHEAAAKEKANQEKESYNRQVSMSRGGSRRGGDRGDGQHGPDGWSVAGSGPPRPPPKAGDLSQFGKISKAAPMTFGPSSVFAGKKDPKARDTSISRTASSSNMFSMLSQNPEIAAEASSKSSRPPSRKPSVDLGQAGILEAPLQRRKLQLLPRSKPTAEEDSKDDATPAASEAGSDDEAASTPAAMTADEAGKKITEDLKEFFSIRSLDEAENYFTTLPAEHRFRLVDKLITDAVERKDADVQLVADLFVRSREKDLCTADAFEEGFNGLAEMVDDVAVDVPKAWTFFAIMVKGAGLDKDDERRARLAEKTMNGEKLLGLLT
ncbi:hypothetical protein BV25DRAFT_808484 [Artomyces pyxidatus]|uniref:Uncharacterized protein n=1 Tax=Artomyces pyxidatus TaxID=48021 RepID=A0ACB8SYK6_9AGAM|nr:hypothetical protein BV25DRAFT_808484 [Artomyces pyxidatus]